MRNELNSNEEMALSMTGMEGTGEHFNMSGSNELLISEKQEKFNDAVDSYVDKFDKHRQELENYAKTISEDINGLEIMPMYSYVLVQPFSKNPFQQVKVSDGGIITDLGGMSPTYKSNETGEYEESEQYIKVGTVVETGHKCEFLKAGDIVMYTIASECPVPFFRQGFVAVAEQRILAVINEKLTERKENLKNGR